MHPGDLLFWRQAQPFVPFRVTLASGRVCEVRHPELIQLLPGSFILFTPSEQEGIQAKAEMFGLSLVEHVEAIAAPSGQNAQT
ncbi:MAG TPA: hypothetical protein VMG10_26530 [Gemmataceae bacterium]|nr:hypothetical protein [Gemmataceae bacterium]